MLNSPASFAVWFSRAASLLLALALLLAVHVVAVAQQPDPNAPPPPPTNFSYFAYFLTVLAVVLGLVVMLRPGSRVDPEAK